jgi:hypothetical protein
MDNPYRKQYKFKHIKKFSKVNIDIINEKEINNNNNNNKTEKFVSNSLNYLKIISNSIKEEKEQ